MEQDQREAHHVDEEVEDEEVVDDRCELLPWYRHNVISHDHAFESTISRDFSSLSN